MSKPIQRKTTITISLAEAAGIIGYGKTKQKNREDWTSVNDYLDADPFDDIMHGGYTEKSILDSHLSLPSGLNGADKLFPTAVALALEDAERDALASHIGNVRRKAIQENLEKISVPGEYQSADGDQISGVPAEVESVEVDTPKNEVRITIINPEHLINDIMNGHGSFAPECEPFLGSDDYVIKRTFIANAGDYFDVYGVSVYYNPDTHYAPAPTEEDFAEQLKFRLSELDNDEVAECIVDAVEAGRFEDWKDAIETASRISPGEMGSPKEILANYIIKFLTQRKSELDEKTSRVIQKINTEVLGC